MDRETGREGEGETGAERVRLGRGEAQKDTVTESESEGPRGTQQPGPLGF